MGVDCDTCGKTFDSERGLEVHKYVEHDEGEEPEHARDIGEKVVDAWQHPKFAFLVGALVGIVLAGSLLLSSPDAFRSDSVEDAGELVLGHYEARAPPGVTYTVDAVEGTDFGMTKVTLSVHRGSVTSSESVYVTGDGKYVVEQRPERLQTDLTAVAE